VRCKGTLAAWMDDCDVGVITAAHTGKEPFVYHCACNKGEPRSQPHQPPSFERQREKAGTPRADKGRGPGDALSAHCAQPEGTLRRVPGSLVRAIFAGALLCAVAACTYSDFPRVSLAQAPASNAAPSPAVAGAFQCDGRIYCSEMTSCAEATFFLHSCPGAQMDGNRNGVPCERQWCASVSAKRPPLE